MKINRSDTYEHHVAATDSRGDGRVAAVGAHTAGDTQHGGAGSMGVAVESLQRE